MCRRLPYGMLPVLHCIACILWYCIFFLCEQRSKKGSLRSWWVMVYETVGISALIVAMKKSLESCNSDMRLVWDRFYIMDKKQTLWELNFFAEVNNFRSLKLIREHSYRNPKKVIVIILVFFFFHSCLPLLLIIT